MVVIFNLQNSQLLTLSIPTDEVFQLNGQNQPVTNLPVVDFHSQPREMLTPKPLKQGQKSLYNNAAHVMMHVSNYNINKISTVLTISSNINKVTKFTISFLRCTHNASQEIFSKQLKHLFLTWVEQIMKGRGLLQQRSTLMLLIKQDQIGSFSTPKLAIYFSFNFYCSVKVVQCIC